jgi:phosphoesterase RecJ-like protein
MADRFGPVVEKIKGGERFLVVSHVNPEGDALGSLLGMALALKGLGKDVVAFLQDPVPVPFGFLPGSGSVVYTLDGEAPFDSTFAVDCGQRERLGKRFLAFQHGGNLINIDHHVSNDSFGDINIVAPDASAAGEIIFDLCKAAGIEITPDIATNLYVAIHTDTGSFRYSSATPESFVKAGELLRLGADARDVAVKVYESCPARKFKLLGKVLDTLDVFWDGLDGKVAMLEVSLDMMDSVGADKADADGFVNYARSIEGVEVGVLLRESAPGDFKISFRSKEGIDVSSVAQGFGGGGHVNAARCNIQGTLEEVKRKDVDARREKFSMTEKV